MKKTLFLLFLCSFCMHAFSVKAQTATWKWANDIPSGGNVGTFGADVAIDQAGNTYTCGFFYKSMKLSGGGKSVTLSSTGQDIFIAKYNASGTILWAKSYGTTSGSLAGARYIKTDKKGHFYISGVFNYNNSNPDSINFGSSHYAVSDGDESTFLACFDTAGAIQWATSARGAGAKDVFGLSVDDNGNIAVSGVFKDLMYFGSNPFYVPGKFVTYVATYDPSGNYKDFTGFYGIIGVTGIKIDPFGDVFITGFFHDSLLYMYSADTDVFLIKYDPHLHTNWASSFGGSKDDEPRGITTDYKGNVIVTGYFTSDTMYFSAGNLLQTGSSGTQDMFLFSADSSGFVNWTQEAGSTGNVAGQSVETDQQRNIYVSGLYTDTLTFHSPKLRAVAGGMDIFVAKYSPKLSPLWGLSAGSDEQDFAQKMSVNANGYISVLGAFSVGSSADNATFGNNTISAGNATDYFVANISTSTTTGITNKISGADLTIYPNPFNNQLNIEMNLEQNAKVQISIYDMFGKLMAAPVNTNQPAGQFTYTINASENNMTSGLYLVKLNINGQIVTRQVSMLK